MEYYVVFEWIGRNYSAYVQDLPGCITTGATMEETEANAKEAIALYINTLKEDCTPVPEPTTIGRPVSVAA